MIILLVIVFGVIALLEIPDLVRRQYWRELVVFSLLLSLGFILSLLLVLGVPLPYVSKDINEFIKGFLY